MRYREKYSLALVRPKLVPDNGMPMALATHTLTTKSLFPLYRTT